MTTGARVLLAAALVLGLLLAAAAVRDGAVAAGPLGDPEASATYQGKSAQWWARRAVQARKDANARGRTIRRLRAELRARHRPGSLAAIALAATAYRVDEAMLVRKARCETGGTFSPFAVNPRSSARGLFQFLTEPRGGTWATTPFARFSVFDPYANALAAAWMHRAGRGGEWVCR